MKLLTLATTALLGATHVAARSSLFGTNTDISPNIDGSLSVPGDNPLQHCQDPKDDVLTIESVDLSPNPPKAYVRSTPPPSTTPHPNHTNYAP